MINKILVGVDNSEHSWKALRCAIQQAKKQNLDKITVVHSEERIEEPEERESADKILEKAEKIADEENIEVETHLLARGYDPDVDIVKFAEENGFGHIIVGSKGRTGLKRVLLGSVAEGIARKAHCAVTIIRDSCPL